MNQSKLNSMPYPYGIQLLDVDLKSCTKQEIKSIGKIFLQKLLLIIPNQNISIRKFATICYSWGNPFVMEFAKDTPIDASLLDEINRVCITTLPGVTKVNINSFLPDGELDWHSDKASNHNPNDAIALYAIDVSEGTCTDFIEGITPYQTLSAEDKRVIDALYCIPSFNSTYFPSSYSADQKKIIEYAVESSSDNTRFPLVRTNRFGHTGILYNRHMFKQFVGKTVQETDDLCRWIESLIFKEDHIYRHYWKNGDFLIMDQTLLLHRRPQQDCSKRDLVRIMFDTSKITS